jgi:hypothetical protein
MIQLVVFLFILVYFDDFGCASTSKSLAPFAIKAIIDHHAAKNITNFDFVKYPFNLQLSLQIEVWRDHRAA